MELDTNGEKPLYRPREWRALERAPERRKRRDNWLWKGDFDTVIFVPVTPGSQLKHRYMREIKATEFKIKVVEQSGTTLKAMLQDQTPSNRGDALMLTAFSAGLTGRDHAEVRTLHELVCQACKSKYVGETSRSVYMYTHGRENFHDFERREESSVMWKHCCDRHERNEAL